MQDQQNRKVELNLEEVDQVVGGSYVTTSMSIGEIIGTDRNLAKYLISEGIPVTGNKSLRSMTLEEAAEVCGVNASAVENAMNEYLSGK